MIGAVELPVHLFHGWAATVERNHIYPPKKSRAHRGLQNQGYKGIRCSVLAIKNKINTHSYLFVVFGGSLILSGLLKIVTVTFCCQNITVKCLEQMYFISLSFVLIPNSPCVSCNLKNDAIRVPYFMKQFTGSCFVKRRKGLLRIYVYHETQVFFSLGEEVR